MDTGSDFHDYSTLSGRIQNFRHRIEWKYIAGIFGLFTLLVLIILTLAAPDQLNVPILKDPKAARETKITNSNGIFTFKGSPNKFQPFRGITKAMLTGDTTPITTIRIHNATIDSPSFSNSLKEFSTTLLKIYLENVMISGEFNRIHLPNIQVFVLKLIPPKSASNRLESYQEEEYIFSRLFFDVIENQKWDLKDVGNLGVEIIYDVNGFKFIHVNRTNGKGEMTVYVPYCNEILKNTNASYKILSLAGCVVSKDSIPRNLEYLNLFDVIVSDGDISEALAGMDNLQNLFLDLPNATIDVSDLPKTLKTLSISTLTVTNRNSNTAIPDVASVSFGFSDISPIINSFGKAFPRVTHAAAFGQQTGNYQFVRACLNAQVSSVIVEGFNANTSTTEELAIQRKLETMNIGPKDINFMLLLPTYGDNIIGFPLTEPQAHSYRYSLLGWHNFLSINAYITADKYVIEI